MSGRVNGGRGGWIDGWDSDDDDFQGERDSANDGNCENESAS